MEPDLESDLRRIFLESAASRNASKNPKGSARGKYNRRKRALVHALDQMEYAIDMVLAQSGAVYKRDEIERLKNSIHNFRTINDLKAVNNEKDQQQVSDNLIDLFELAPWQPSSPAEQAELDKIISEQRIADEMPDTEDLKTKR